MDLIINGRFLTQHVTGVQRYARELVQALDAISDAEPMLRITVISPRLTEPAPAWRNIKLHQVGHLQGHAWEQLELPWYSRGRTLFCPGNTAPLISLLGRQRVVVTVHDLSYRYFPEAYSLQFRLLYGAIMPIVLRRAVAVITVSEAERRAIGARYPEAIPRLHAIQNGGLPDRFINDHFDTCIDQGYVLYVGSLSKRKNFGGIFQTACELARKRNFRFIFVGGVAGGISDAGLAIPADLTSRVVFKGQLDDTRALINYYRGAACLLFPSFYEASPLPPIEAMACGCPVIVSDIPALRERCGDAAIYCNPHDIGSIVSAVEHVIDDSALCQRLRHQGHHRAAIYTWKRCAVQTLQLLHEIAGASSLPSAQSMGSHL